MKTHAPRIRNHSDSPLSDLSSCTLSSFIELFSDKDGLLLHSAATVLE